MTLKNTTKEVPLLHLTAEISSKNREKITFQNYSNWSRQFPNVYLDLLYILYIFIAFQLIIQFI